MGETWTTVCLRARNSSSVDSNVATAAEAREQHVHCGFPGPMPFDKRGLKQTILTA